MKYVNIIAVIIASLFFLSTGLLGLLALFAGSFAASAGLLAMTGFFGLSASALNKAI